MTEDESTTAHSEARRMLETFASVGATHFNVTWTNLADQPHRSHKGISLREIVRAAPVYLDAAAADQLNVIVRPYGRDVWFIQLDDLKTDQLARLAPRIFLILETSPGNHQAWLALPGQHDKEFARRVRRGAGTDKRATGATRLAGSLNFKTRYAPDFPRVAIHTAQPGRKVTAAALEELGLVAAPEVFAPFVPPARASGSRSIRWPSYQMALDSAPLNRDGSGPDRSNADLKWCMMLSRRSFIASWLAQLVRWPKLKVGRQALARKSLEPVTSAPRALRGQYVQHCGRVSYVLNYWIGPDGRAYFSNTTMTS